MNTEKLKDEQFQNFPGQNERQEESGAFSKARN